MCFKNKTALSRSRRDQIRRQPQTDEIGHLVNRLNYTTYTHTHTHMRIVQANDYHFCAPAPHVAK